MKLNDLDSDDINDAIDKVINSNILEDLAIDEDAKVYLMNQSNHDLRYVYNLIEIAYYSTDNHHITKELLTNISGSGNIIIDKLKEYNHTFN